MTDLERKLLRLQLAAPIYAQLVGEYRKQFEIASNSLTQMQRLSESLAKSALSHADVLMEVNDEQP